MRKKRTSKNMQRPPGHKTRYSYTVKAFTLDAEDRVIAWAEDSEGQVVQFVFAWASEYVYRLALSTGLPLVVIVNIMNAMPPESWPIPVELKG